MRAVKSVSVVPPWKSMAVPVTPSSRPNSHQFGVKFIPASLSAVPQICANSCEVTCTRGKVLAPTVSWSHTCDALAIFDCSAASSIGRLNSPLFAITEVGP